ncbi:2478_t:CDS:2, partial [Gigaspora margarita]
VAATQMSDKIQKYTNEIYDKTAFMAAILDPRVKLELMPDDINTEANRAVFNNIFRTEYSALSFNNSSTNSESLNLTYTEKIAQKKRKTNMNSNRMDEFNQYLSEAITSMDIDPLDWWKLNCTRFPNLSKMAKDYLAIQSTSVPSEQVFSKAGDTIWAKPYISFSVKDKKDIRTLN